MYTILQARHAGFMPQLSCPSRHWQQTSSIFVYRQGLIPSERGNCSNSSSGRNAHGMALVAFRQPRYRSLSNLGAGAVVRAYSDRKLRKWRVICWPHDIHSECHQAEGALYAKVNEESGVLRLLSSVRISIDIWFFTVPLTSSTDINLCRGCLPW